jgi:hypothetical protein
MSTVRLSIAIPEFITSSQAARTRHSASSFPDDILNNFAARDITPLLKVSDIEIDGLESETGHKQPNEAIDCESA